MTIHISVELSHVCPLEEIAEHAAALESLGYYRVWVPDTIVSPWEAWLAAGLMVQHTARLKIGLGVTNPYTRHPMVVAQMAATMQHLSTGRLALSIGKGIPRLLKKAGVDPCDSAVEECITALRNLIAGERTSMDGEAFQIDGLRIRTLPPDKNIPIYLAAMSASSWKTALRVADGVATIFNEEMVDIRNQLMAEKKLPTAALVPFSLSQEDFFEGWNRADSKEELMERVQKMETEGIEEVIVAYRELADLQVAAQLI
ncbi:MAG: LLM class flavin-dependent oxidoreductase [Deltaproteobacteria bacterium]|jgi:alkanesulfonate monooxygenase SsuD/methylene tetrahydromethanopterin reductase-like flavin-dependent oxidoreductase (luciferase family)|nr:LLM class flavin-dependent oxidoreductase [Deltaproteobacteria bacterium]